MEQAQQPLLQSPDSSPSLELHLVLHVLEEENENKNSSQERKRFAGLVATKGRGKERR